LQPALCGKPPLWDFSSERASSSLRGKVDKATLPKCIAPAAEETARSPARPHRATRPKQRAERTKKRADLSGK